MSSPTTHHSSLQANLDAERLRNANLRKMIETLRGDLHNSPMDGWGNLLFHLKDVARKIDISDEKIIFYVSAVKFHENK